MLAEATIAYFLNLFDVGFEKRKIMIIEATSFKLIRGIGRLRFRGWITAFYCFEFLKRAKMFTHIHFYTSVNGGFIALISREY